MDWAYYFRGVLEELKKKYKLSIDLRGTFKGEIPSGGTSINNFNITFYEFSLLWLEKIERDCSFIILGLNKLLRN